MDEIEDADNDIDDDNLFFIGSNKEKFNFNTFKKPLYVVLAIYNGEISLKDAEFKQSDLEKKIGDLYGYEPKNEKEKEDISQVLMQANDLLEYREKIIDAFKNETFLSQYLKKSDDAAHDYFLRNVNKFIKKGKSMEEKINLSLFEEFFELSSPANYAKMIINTKNADENKKNVKEIEYRISNLEDRIKK